MRSWIYPSCQTLAKANLIHDDSFSRLQVHGQIFAVDMVEKDSRSSRSSWTGETLRFLHVGWIFDKSDTTEISEGTGNLQSSL